MRQRLWTIGLTAFVVVDVVLVYLAFRHVRPADEAATAADSPSASPSTGSSGGPSRESSGSTGSAVEAGQGPLLLALAADGTVLRATRGDCTGAKPVVTVSTDGGHTFTRRQVTPGLNQVLGVQALGKGNLRIVGATEVCRAELYVGSAGKRTWAASQDDGSWHRLLSRSSAIHSPFGVVDTPCEPIDVTASTSVRLLCFDKTIMGTDDDGQSWVYLGRLPGATSISYVTSGVGYAVARQPNCHAAVMVTNDGGVTWDQASCLGGGDPRAIAVRGDVALAQVGDTLMRSEDSGASWQSLS